MLEVAEIMEAEMLEEETVSLRKEVLQQGEGPVVEVQIEEVDLTEVEVAPLEVVLT
jgi:hypothetical protein